MTAPATPPTPPRDPGAGPVTTQAPTDPKPADSPPVGADGRPLRGAAAAAAARKAAKDAKDSVGSGKPGRPSKAEASAKQITGTIAGIGVAVSMFDAFDGQVIIERADDLGTSLAELAATNPKVQRALDALSTGTSWAAVLSVAAGIVIPIAGHHGLLPDQAVMLAGPKAMETHMRMVARSEATAAPTGHPSGP